MVLPDSAKFIIGTPIVLADSTYSPTGTNSLGTRTDDLDLTNITARTAEQSARFDFTANIDVEYVLAACLEWGTAPAAGETVDFHIGYNNADNTTGWPGGLVGGEVSADYAGYSSNLTDSLKQLDFLGSMVATVQLSGTPQIDTSISTFTPRDRYGVLVAHNQSAADPLVNHAVQQAVRITPLTMQIQD